MLRQSPTHQPTSPRGEPLDDVSSGEAVACDRASKSPVPNIPLLNVRRIAYVGISDPCIMYCQNPSLCHGREPPYVPPVSSGRLVQRRQVRRPARGEKRHTYIRTLPPSLISNNNNSVRAPCRRKEKNQKNVRTLAGAGLGTGRTHTHTHSRIKLFGRGLKERPFADACGRGGEGERGKGKEKHWQADTGGFVGQLANYMILLFPPARGAGGRLHIGDVSPKTRPP